MIFLPLRVILAFSMVDCEYYCCCHYQDIYFSPIDKTASVRYEERFLQFLPTRQCVLPAGERSDDRGVSGSNPKHSQPQRWRSSSLLVYGHNLRVPCQVVGRRTARFSFHSLCDQAYGAADYIELARIYSVIFISDIPRMDLSHKNEVEYGSIKNNHYYYDCFSSLRFSDCVAAKVYHPH